MKCVLYIRTSTAEQQFPEKQISDCKAFAETRGYEVIEILQEKLSAFKKVERPQYEKVKQLAHEGKIQAVIVWALDRWVRNRDTLLDDVTSLRQAGVKLHSVKEQWLEAVNVEGSIGKTIQDFLLGLIGSIAEMESQRKRDRTKMAYEFYKKEDPDGKRKYKKWGRKNLDPRVQKEVIELFKKGLSLRGISESVIYYDKYSNRKKVSLGYVHKIISKYKAGSL